MISAPHLTNAMTTETITAKNTNPTIPEFGRVQDVQRLFGIKRGILYRWIGDGKIKSVCIREPGNKLGVRLIHLASVRDYINRQMQQSTVNYNLPTSNFHSRVPQLD
jgi:hypothetical protein